jgi:ribosome recycling factor
MGKYLNYTQQYGLKHIENAVVMKKEYLEELGSIRKEVSNAIKKANKDEAKLRSDYKNAKEKVEKVRVTVIYFSYSC